MAINIFPINSFHHVFRWDELEIAFTPDRSMVDPVLGFWTWNGGDEEGRPSQGGISCQKVDRDLQDAACHLIRPLTAPDGAR